MKNRTEAMNRISRAANKLVPLLQEQLAKGFKLNGDGRLYKKDHDKVSAILRNQEVYRIRLDQRYSTFYLEITDYYAVDVGCKYTSVEIPIIHKHDLTIYPYEKRKMVTEKQLLKAQEQLMAVEASLQKLRTRRIKLRNLLAS